MLVQRHIRRFEGELSAVGHGVGGIHDDVHDDLFHLSGINFYRFKSQGGNNPHIHFPAHQMPQSAGHVGEDPVQIEDFRLENLFASVSQELTRQGRGPVGRLADFARVFSQRIFLRRIRWVKTRAKSARPPTGPRP